MTVHGAQMPNFEYGMFDRPGVAKQLDGCCRACSAALRRPARNWHRPSAHPARKTPAAHQTGRLDDVQRADAPRQGSSIRPHIDGIGVVARRRSGLIAAPAHSLQ